MTQNFRKQMLDKQLQKIEQEAEWKSIAIMNKAGDLADAHTMCLLLNAADGIGDPLFPSVHYESATHSCKVMIFAFDNGAAVQLAADKFARNQNHLLASGWSSEGRFGDNYVMRFEEFSSVEIVIEPQQFIAYLEQSALDQHEASESRTPDEQAAA